MSVEAKIQDAQRRILDTMIELEESIAALYDGYATFCPWEPEFWRQMAREERDHATALRGLQGFLDRGVLFQNIGRFDRGAMQAMIDELRRLAGKRCPMTDAVRTAIRIENSLLESRFYDVVTSDSPDFQLVAQFLSESTRAHVARIREKGALNRPLGPHAPPERV